MKGGLTQYTNYLKFSFDCCNSDCVWWMCMTVAWIEIHFETIKKIKIK